MSDEDDAFNTITRDEDLPDPRLQSFAVVTAIVPGERPVVRLSRTIFLPEEEGQTADRGWIGPARVLHVVRHEGEINHHVEMAESLVVGERYPIAVDAEFRYVEAAGRYLAAKIFMEILQRKPEDYQ